MKEIIIQEQAKQKAASIRDQKSVIILKEILQKSNLCQRIKEEGSY